MNNIGIPLFVSDFFHCNILLIKIIPLRAKQVSEANLRSEQGGINFTPFVLSLPYAKKKKKLKFYIWMGVSSKMSVCLLSVACDEFVPNYLLNHWSDWAKNFITKTRENVYLGILILKFRGQRPRIKALG
jgi:hypothetical protein